MSEKYLFFDMDGTLISRKERKIPQSAIDGIHQAMDNGHHCFICTGRGYRMAQEYFDQLVLPGIVFSNGAGIAYNGKILETRDLHPSTVERLRSICENLGGGYGLLTTTYTYQNQNERNRMGKHFFERNIDSDIQAYYDRRGLKLMDEYQNEGVQKMDFSFQSELTADIFFARVPASLHTVVAGGYYATMGRTGGEITANGVTKGSGIERVLDMFSVDARDTYGFGDSSNDLEMMEVVGHGVAMGNGSDQIKQKADYVTDDVDENGIYNALKHYGLI